MFQKLDDFEWDADILRPPAAPNDIEKENTADDRRKRLLHVSFEALIAVVPADSASSTACIDAACFIIQQGLLNVPETNAINIKQCLAVLHAAAWLQKSKMWEWTSDKVQVTSVYLNIIYFYVDFSFPISGRENEQPTHVFTCQMYGQTACIHFSEIPICTVHSRGHPKGQRRA